MMKLTRFLLLALFAPAAAFCADAPKFQILDSRVILPAEFVPQVPAEKLSVPLALVVEAGSEWAAPGVLEGMLGKASAIFAPCGLTLGAAEVLAVRWTPQALQELNDANPYFGPSQLHVIDEPLLPQRRPAGFLFTNSIPATASAYSLKSVNQFIHTGQPKVAKMLNTTWLTSNWHSAHACGDLDCPGGDIAPGFSVFAHELAHLFGNLDHVDDVPNLMTNASTKGAKSGDLTKAQCSEIVKLYGF